MVQKYNFTDYEIVYSFGIKIPVSNDANSDISFSHTFMGSGSNFLKVETYIYVRCRLIL